MSEAALFGDDPLAMAADEVARLTGSQRTSRVDDLIVESRAILHDAIVEHVTSDSREVAAVVGLFSGGNDSTVLVHLFRDQLTHCAHANTGVGIEATRDFVRNTCEEWGTPLLERIAPREMDRYRHLVLTDQRGKQGQALGGFPGPAMHWKMFTRLKERALEVVRNELVGNPRRQRVVFVAGRRRTESKRRADVPKSERKGSTVWVSPFVNWTKLDLLTYRLMCADVDPVPINDVTALAHMSGECLCGSMASRGERDELSYWFPGAFEQIAEMEAALSIRDDIPEHRKTWGWGADPAKKAAEDDYLAEYAAEPEHVESEAPMLCAACDDRFQLALFGESADLGEQQGDHRGE